MASEVMQYRNRKNIFKPQNILITVFACFACSLSHAQQLSASDAAISAQEFTGGRVLKVKPPRDNTVNYRVRVLLPEGKVRNVIVDGNSGKVHFRDTQKNRKKQPKLLREFNHAPTNR